MSKSLIYAGNSTTLATVATGTVIPFPNIVRRYGCNLGLSGGNVVARGEGYYEGVVNITFAGTATGTVKFTVYKDGVEIPYANASRTTADATTYNVSIPFADRLKCNCESTFTVVASGAVVNVNNVGILVDKA